MPTTDKHAPGAFCWIELATTDRKAAGSFYTSLFGWKTSENPMGPDAFYTMFTLDGHVSAGGYTMSAQEQAQGVPPHWNLYVNVANADDAAKRAAELGGKVIDAPFDVQTHGRMAVIQDPGGAVFAVWQAGDHNGIGVRDEPGSLCWADLNTPDPQVAVLSLFELHRH